MEKTLSNYIMQVGNFLIAQEDCVVTLDLDENYTMNDDLILDEEDNIIWVKSVIAKIEFSDLAFDMVLDYPVNFFIEGMELKKKQSIVLHYKKESNILEVTVAAVEMKAQILYLNRLLSGKELSRDATHLLLKLFNVFSGGVSKLDLVHFETLISNILRDKADPSNPARLGKTFDPVVLNIKDMVFRKGSFLQSLNFENVNKAINVALITPTEKDDRTILEKVLLNEIIE